MHMYVNSLDPIVSDGNKLFSAQAHHERILLVKDLDPLDVAVVYWCFRVHGPQEYATTPKKKTALCEKNNIWIWNIWVPLLPPSSNFSHFSGAISLDISWRPSGSWYSGAHEHLPHLKGFSGPHARGIPTRDDDAGDFPFLQQILRLWLVVEPTPWKIWVSQLGWLFPTYGQVVNQTVIPNRWKNKRKIQTTNQAFNARSNRTCGGFPSGLRDWPSTTATPGKSK